MSLDPHTLLEQASQAAVIASAWSTGLLDIVLAEPMDAASAATRAGLAEGPCAVVLEALAGLGVIRREGDTYGPPEAQLPLSPQEIASLFASLPDRLRGAPSVRPMDGDTAQRGRAYAQVAPTLAELQERAAGRLAAALPPAQHVLDVGTGSGVWGLTLAEQHGSALTVVDLPEVLPQFERAAAQRNIDATCVAGDYHEVELPTVDRILAANIVHLEPASRVQALVRRMAAALRPGGELVVIEPTSTATQRDERTRTLYAVHLMLRSNDARAWSYDEIRGFLQDAGLSVRRIGLGEQALEAILGTARANS